MACEAFKEVKFKAESLERIELCNSIIESYQEQGLRLTLRQLYYQLVTRNAIRNEERSYKNLGSLVSDARLAGMIDWDAIEDRVRVPRRNSEFSGLESLARAAVQSYRLPRWEGQEKYVELWVEKDALAGVLRPIASDYHVTMMVNRGYSSQSAMYEAAVRFNEEGGGRDKVLLYLGDFDPSGEDMVRDVGDRLRMFGVRHLDVDKVALTKEQIRRFNPPPNPAKTTDSRAAAYIAEHGDSSWEVDAIDPADLATIIRDAIGEHVDLDLMEEIKVKEESDKKRLLAAVKGLK